MIYIKSYDGDEPKSARYTYNEEGLKIKDVQGYLGSSYEYIDFDKNHNWRKCIRAFDERTVNYGWDDTHQIIERTYTYY